MKYYQNSLLKLFKLFSLAIFLGIKGKNYLTFQSTLFSFQGMLFFTSQFFLSNMINSLSLIWISSLIVFCQIFLVMTFPFLNLFLLIPLISFLMISFPMNLLPFFLLHLIVPLELGNHYPTCVTIIETLFHQLIVLLITLFFRFFVITVFFLHTEPLFIPFS